MLLALWGARSFVHSLAHNKAIAPSTPNVTILKPVKGNDSQMYAAFATHCRQEYAGQYEILFGVSSLADPAVPEIERLRAEFPDHDIRVIQCPAQLGTSGKVSNLIQMLREAKYEHVVINDSDIEVSAHYLQNVLRGFTDPEGRPSDRTLHRRHRRARNPVDRLVQTRVPRHRDRFHGWRSKPLGRLKAEYVMASDRHWPPPRRQLPQSADLNSLQTVSPTITSWAHRISMAGSNIELCSEVVKTTVPGYDLRSFWDHQIRWARTRARRSQVGLPGPGRNLLSSLGRDDGRRERLRIMELHSLQPCTPRPRHGRAYRRRRGSAGWPGAPRPLAASASRLLRALLLWIWSFAGDMVIWRGEKFRLKDGRIARI